MAAEAEAAREARAKVSHANKNFYHFVCNVEFITLREFL